VYTAATRLFNALVDAFSGCLQYCRTIYYESFLGLLQKLKKMGYSPYEPGEKVIKSSINISLKSQENIDIRKGKSQNKKYGVFILTFLSACALIVNKIFVAID